jgi:putative membrane protein
VRPGESRQRDHLANERTLLSWIRMTIALFALGFVIARFGVFLEEISAVSPLHTRIGTWHSLLLGMGFVAAGIVTATLALSRYLAVERDIEAGVVQAHRGLIYTLVAMSTAAGLLLLIYLVIAWPAR